MTDIDSSYVSASSTRNFFLDDPLIDWLELYGKEKGYKKSESPYSFSKFIMNMGKQFESYIFSIIKTNHPHDYISIPTFYGKDYSEKETIKHMSMGTPLIYQGLLVNRKNKTYGYPDLIIRSDFINHFFNRQIITPEKASKGCSFSPVYHYRIIDIKYSTIHLQRDGISNSGSSFAYKGQVFIYNEALGRLQNFVPRCSYILGRMYSQNDKSFSSFETCGVVDFVKEPVIGETTERCLRWVQRLRQEGSSWDIYPTPVVRELYPNMKNDNDAWSGVKQALAKHVNEITLVWNCGVRDRNYLHSLGVTSYLDERCTTDTMNKGGKKIKQTIDKILAINRGDLPVNHSVNTTTLSEGYYVDFETVNNIYDIKGKEPDRLVMIGVIGPDSEGVEQETVLVADALSDLSEKQIISSFLELITPNGENNPIVYHYSDYEPRYFKKKLETLGIVTSVNIQWVDLLSVVKDKNMFMKGCLNFSLKSYMNAFGYHKSKDDIINGNEAMVALIKYYLENDTNVIDKIKEYNIQDCKMLKVLKDIL